ncbi:MAG: ABC transporter ATP-binding protein [Burkholderiaceae bacterium]|nr:ABC transporter ATP-binding protein [Rhodoferax sp.]MCP5261738.1 ABC transporter ATP-binding protein [Rhodoferax sp.]MCW5642876.1 ABC transporter ATP-binding protein [Rhodoferax sp.]
MLELRGIRKVFDDHAGGHWVLADGLDLQVAPGQTVAVLGPSGSGKSTLLKIIAGLEAQDGGSVGFDGVDLARVPPERRGFALMFQDFALFPHLNVLDNVAFGLREQGLSRSAARERALAMLAVFGLQAHARHRVWKLSGGEQQRVALARALITAPRLLLLDEPFSALDATLRASLRAEFATRIAAAGIATVLVTHDEAEARAMAQHGYRLDAGRLRPLW